MPLKSDTTLYAVLKYLKDNKYQQSWLALQSQSQIKLYTYPRELQFLRKILLKGDFSQSIKFISTLQPHLAKKVFKSSCLLIYTQKLYQLINSPNESQLKRLFQEQFHTCTSQEQYQNLFKLLTYRKTQEIQGLSDWTVKKGRLRVFEELLPVVEKVIIKKENVNSCTKSEKYMNKMVENINLDQVMAVYMEKINNIKISMDENKKQTENVQKSQLISKNTNNNSQLNKKSFINNISQLNKNHHIHEDKRQINLDLSQSAHDKSQYMNFQKKSQIIHNNNSQIKDPSMRSGQKSNIKNNISSYNNSKLDYNYNNSNYYNNSNVNFQQRFQQDNSQINQIQQQQQKSQNINKSIKHNRQDYNSNNPNQQQQQYSNNNNNNNQQHLSHDHNENIQFLQQTNSIVYNHTMDAEKYHENFTFSNNQAQLSKPRQIIKLATISDQKAIRTCKFSNSGNFFAVGTNSSYLKIFYVENVFQENKMQVSFDPIYQINNLHSKSIFCLDWSKDQTKMVTCSNDLMIKITEFDQNFTSHEISVIGRHQSCIRMVKFNQQHDKIFSCGDDSLIKIWDMGKVKRCYNLKGHKSGISAFKLTQNQNQLYSVSKDSTIKRWDLRSLDCVATSKPQQSQITFIANHTDRIVASNKNGNVLFFDQSLNLEYEVRIHDEEIRSIQCAKSKDLFLTASFDGHVGIFSEKTCHSPDYFQHNQLADDKVVFATFLDHPEYKGFASTSTLGLCHIYSYF